MYLAFGAAAVRLARCHLDVDAGTHGGNALLTRVFDKIWIAAFGFLSSPFGTQAVRKRWNVGILIDAAILIGAPQARALRAVFARRSNAARRFAHLILFHVHLFRPVANLANIIVAPSVRLPSAVRLSMTCRTA